MASSIINSDDGVISGTSGLKSSGGDDGVLNIQNNGTTAVTVASDGDVTLAADLSVTGNLLFNSGYGSVATAYGCRAWVKFNGTGTVAVIASGNVTSITDNGVGNYTVNFTTAMPDTNYAAMFSCKLNNSIALVQQGSSNTTSVANIVGFQTTNGTALDAGDVYVAIFR